MIVGVDIGGTKTHLALEADGWVDHRVVATSTWQRNGLFGDGNVQRLVGLFRDEVSRPERTPLAIGAHGCDSPAQVGRFGALVSQAWPGPVRVVNDAELLAPAFGVAEAICLIVGTGSIVIGRTVDDEPVYVGGHGWLLDDFGSAPAITREAVRAVLRATDRGEERELLAEALMSHFGVDAEVELSLRFTASAHIVTWAAPAHLVFAAADAGSAPALEVVDQAAESLARDIALAQARGARGTTVVAAGGVVTNQPRLFESISRHLQLRAPELKLELLDVAPVIGALEIARRLNGSTPSRPQHQQPVNDNREGTR
jgi:glucosamine kinase